MKNNNKEKIKEKVLEELDWYNTFAGTLLKPRKDNPKLAEWTRAIDKTSKLHENKIKELENELKEFNKHIQQMGRDEEELKKQLKDQPKKIKDRIEYWKGIEKQEGDNPEEREIIWRIIKELEALLQSKGS